MFTEPRSLDQKTYEKLLLRREGGAILGDMSPPEFEIKLREKLWFEYFTLRNISKKSEQISGNKNL